MQYDHIVVPADGAKITINADTSINVPDRPIIPFVEGDGIGIDVTPVMRRVVDAAALKAYRGRRRIEWMEIYAGEKANRVYGSWFPGSLILSAEMMLRYLKWNEAANLIVKGVANTIVAKELTYDLARLREAIRAPKRELAAKKNVEEDLQRLIPGATLMSTSGFGEAVVRHMDD